MWPFSRISLVDAMRAENTPAVANVKLSKTGPYRCLNTLVIACLERLLHAQPIAIISLLKPVDVEELRSVAWS